MTQDPTPLSLPVPRSATALMQHLQLLAGREGHRHWCGGVVDAQKFSGFVAKMASRYPICKTTRQRTYDRTRGRAVVHLVAQPIDGARIVWWLLSDAGVGGLADCSMPDAHVAADAMSADGHIVFGDYVLLYATKREQRTVVDARTGRPKRFAQ